MIKTALLSHPEAQELLSQPMVRAYVGFLQGQGIESVAHILPPGMATALAARMEEGMSLAAALADPSVLEAAQAAEELMAQPSEAQVVLDILNQLGRCPHCGGHALLSRFGGVPDDKLMSLQAEAESSAM